MEEFFGYRFKNPALLQEALTAPAYRIDFPDARDNQRLEFLGDSILNFAVSSFLFKKFPAASEGELTMKRAQMVSTLALARCAEKNSLCDFLRINARGKAPASGSKCYADAVEALVGALWLDGGVEAVESVLDMMGLYDESTAESSNPKGELQIYSQALEKRLRPEYVLVSVEGKAHEPVFTVEVRLEGVGSAVAKDSTRKGAEAKAAAKLMSQIKGSNE